ncbi:hypothetical protein M2284_003467 [Rhodococcus sp. LBL1]|nr:hypothetical protein [Rhodococcus sp. LBL1]MDH6685009.1 hypothetical protein [Rhodococcus sp. LBL2]
MPTLQDTINRAHRIARDQGLEVSPSRISKTIRKAWHYMPELTDADLYKCLTYADPTGDTAVEKAIKAKERAQDGSRRPERNKNHSHYQETRFK